MKKCKICEKEKDLSEFYKHKKTKDNLSPYCKSCHSVKVKENRRTFEGLIVEIYSGQKTASKRRGMSPPHFTKQELYDWCKNDKEFNRLYKEWVESDYHIDKRPTTDRLDELKTYSFDNIQALTYRDNINKYHNDLIKGRTKRALKPVCQYSLEGVFIKEYYSIAEASRQSRINQSKISACANGCQKTSGGYIWKFKNIKEES